jgi:hypothetical protein
VHRTVQYAYTSATVPGMGPPTSTLTADSGASDTYVATDTPLANVRRAPHPVDVRMGDGSTHRSTHIGDLHLPGNVSSKACIARIVPGLRGCSLLSIGVLTDAGYIVTFTADSMYVWDDTNTVVLHGTRNQTTRLWEVALQQHPHKVPLPPRQPDTFDVALVATRIGDHKIAHLIAYCHATLFSQCLAPRARK